MRLKVEIGSYEVIESSSVLMDKAEESLILHLSVEDNFMGKVIIKFVSDSLTKLNMQAEQKNGNLYIMCYNFDNEAEVGTREAGYLQNGIWKEILYETLEKSIQ